jgi:uncharacterized protein
LETFKEPIMNRENKSLVFTEVKALDDEQMSIEGYASVFGNVDGQGDIVEKGAFNNEWNRTKKIKMLLQHDPKNVIGVWDEVKEDPKGLYIKGRFADIPEGQKAYKLAKMGAIDSLSIGFMVAKNGSTYDSKSKTRLLKNLNLMEVSLVTFPANEAARITAVKSDYPSVREFEQIMQDAGLSRSDARMVLNKGYKALLETKQDAGEADSIEGLKALIENNTKLLTK